ncbi:hypothetical protein JCM1841_001238 [Sporobolomyces salmonicolor]
MATRLTRHPHLSPSKHAPLRRPHPRPRPHLPPAKPSSPSPTHLGTAYELLAQSLFSSPPYNMSLIRVGGRQDAGVDLRGRWSGTLSGRPAKEAVSPGTRKPSWPILVQCKAEKDRVGPATVRELEGTLQAESFKLSSSRSRRLPSSSRVPSSTARNVEPLGFLVTLHGFTDDALRRAWASDLPISLLHLAVANPEKLGVPDEDVGEVYVVSSSMNPRMKELLRDRGKQVEGAQEDERTG